jgi:hypothetical protein
MLCTVLLTVHKNDFFGCCMQGDAKVTFLRNFKLVKV